MGRTTCNGTHVEPNRHESSNFRKSVNKGEIPEVQRIRMAFEFSTELLCLPSIRPNPSTAPSPDILFPSELLGIEITNYYLHQGKDGSPTVRMEQPRKEILKEARFGYETTHADRPDVWALWQPSEICREKCDAKVLSREISRCVGLREPHSGLAELRMFVVRYSRHVRERVGFGAMQIL